MQHCTSCGSVHMAPVPCGMTWVQRLRSVRLDPSATPSRTKLNYYDTEPINQVFGEDSKERLYDETDGRGPAYRHPRTGKLFRKDRHSGQPVPVSPGDTEFYLGKGAETEDPVEA